MSSSSTYIVRLIDNATERDLKETVDKFRSLGGTIIREDKESKGFTGTISAEGVTSLQQLPVVAMIVKTLTP